jgi:hypothetical protein
MTMKTILAGLMCLLSASAASAAPQIVRWQEIVGVITAQNISNPITDPNTGDTIIDSGTFAWTTKSGRARVNLVTGATSFQVRGLSINGAGFSGTPGPVTEVRGTLVCNAGEVTQALLDTPDVSLGAQGDAQFSGVIGPMPAACDNPMFLIRIAVPAGAAGRWIATGAERTIVGD